MPSASEGSFSRTSRRPSRLLLISVTVLSAAWLAATLIATFASAVDDLSPRSMLSMMLWMFCLAVLWAGITWAAAAGLAAAVVSVAAGTAALEQAIFLILMAGVCAAHSCGGLRRSFVLLSVLWVGWYASHLQDLSNALFIFCSAVLLLMASYAIGSGIRRLMEKQEWTRRALYEAEKKHHDAVTAERKSLARDLHDIVAHDITVLAMQAEAAQLGQDEGRRERTLQMVRDSSRATLQDLRRIVEVLEEDGAVQTAGSARDRLLRVGEALEKFQEELEAVGVPTVTNAHGDWESVSLSVQRVVYRILQECSTNIIKYGARGGEDVLCTMTAEAAEDHVNLYIINQLPGETAIRRDASFSSHAGLRSIEDRARTFGGLVVAGPDESGCWSTKVLKLSKS